MRRPKKTELTHSEKIKAGILKAKREGRAGKGKRGNPVLRHEKDDGGKLLKEINDRKKKKADDFAYEHRATISKMREGGASLQSVADHFNDAGVPTRRGKLWNRTTVRNLLARPETTLEKMKRTAKWSMAVEEATES